jgi:hypothetical protein
MLEFKNSNDAVNSAKVISLNNEVMDTVSNSDWMHTTQEGETTLKHARRVAGLLFAIIIVLFALTVTSCKNNGNEPEQIVKTLAGTKWQLVKLTHTETKIERPIFIGDDVFTQFVPTMNFETDSTGYLAVYNRSNIQYPFNLGINEIEIKVGIKQFVIGGYSATTDNIGLFISLYYLNFCDELSNYKIEDNKLKLSFAEDRDFFLHIWKHNPNNNEWEIENLPFSNFGTCTDTNFYNCLVFEEVK